MKSCFGAGAAVGFGALFRIPRKALVPVLLLGAVGVFAKALLLHFDVNIILSSFAAAALVGVVSLHFANVQDTPPVIFSLPAVIPMVPGLFTYRAMLGIIKLAVCTEETFGMHLAYTFNNGVKAAFILMVLAVGVSVPNLVFRKRSFYEMPKL